MDRTRQCSRLSAKRRVDSIELDTNFRFSGPQRSQRTCLAGSDNAHNRGVGTLRSTHDAGSAMPACKLRQASLSPRFKKLSSFLKTQLGIFNFYNSWLQRRRKSAKLRHTNGDVHSDINVQFIQFYWKFIHSKTFRVLSAVRRQDRGRFCSI